MQNIILLDNTLPRNKFELSYAKAQNQIADISTKPFKFKSCKNFH